MPNYAPPGQLTGGLFLRYVNENYHYPAIPMTAPSGDWTLVGHGEGIKRDYNLTVGPDINYRPSADLNLHVYYTYERIYFDNLGNGACAESNTGDCAGSAGYWRSTYTSGMNTAGLSGNGRPPTSSRSRRNSIIHRVLCCSASSTASW